MRALANLIPIAGFYTHGVQRLAKRFRVSKEFVWPCAPLSDPNGWTSMAARSLFCALGETGRQRNEPYEKGKMKPHSREV